MLIYLLRHGLTEYNAQKRYQGQRDIPLSAEGLSQLRRADIDPKVVYITPLQRTAQTARVLFPDAKLVVVKDLQEMCFGSFEGKNYVEMEHDADYQAWVKANCESKCPDGERKDDFSARICNAFSGLVDKALAENIDMINRVYNTGSMKAAACAAVVLDVKDGSVLAASNYPSFDQNLYATQYSEYSADESLPLFNRSLQGLYTPGSTFKPAVAVAALDAGVINRYSTVYCNGVYTYYDTYRPKCTRHGHSGNIDVITAIKWSCNIFFYDVGRRTTSDVYDAYAYKLGMGVRTGVEVSEALGHLTSKTDSNYIESLDVQAAIGQGNTVVSPVQLATYAATIANRGTRYRTHFVKAILDTNTGEVLQETQPEVMDVIEDRGDTFDLVKQGMIGVSETVSGLSNYPVTIACKTGTPQRSETYYVGSTRKHYTNTTMIAYGPAEDAEIALGIVIEYGGGGARAGNLAADIFNAYAALKEGTLTVEEPEAESASDAAVDGQDAPEAVGNGDAPADQPAA